jgi:hypothetical protein
MGAVWPVVAQARDMHQRVRAIALWPPGLERPPRDCAGAAQARCRCGRVGHGASFAP